MDPDTLYSWKLLPDEELERIAYNSRKQQKARLRVHSLEGTHMQHHTLLTLFINEVDFTLSNRRISRAVRSVRMFV